MDKDKTIYILKEIHKTFGDFKKLSKKERYDYKNIDSLFDDIKQLNQELNTCSTKQWDFLYSLDTYNISTIDEIKDSLQDKIIPLHDYREEYSEETINDFLQNVKDKQKWVYFDTYNIEIPAWEDAIDSYLEEQLEWLPVYIDKYKNNKQGGRNVK